MGKSICEQITSVCFVVNKRINKKITVAQGKNGKRIKENPLGFRFPHDVFMSLGLHVSISSCFHVMSPCFHVSNLHVHVSRFWILQKENGTNRKWRLLFVVCKQKTDAAKFDLFAAKGNGKQTFLFSMVGER